jgi:hypothetical protein
MRCVLTCLVFFALVVTGCETSARYVRKDPDGGIVAIPAGPRGWPNYHRKEAERLMGLVCPNGYMIVEEKEVPVATSGKPRTEHHLTFRSIIQVPENMVPAPVVEAAPPGLPPRPIPIR